MADGFKIHAKPVPNISNRWELLNADSYLGNTVIWEVWSNVAGVAGMQKLRNAVQIIRMRAA